MDDESLTVTASETTITDRLRHIMNLRHLTQRGLARLLRLDPSNLSKVLTGKLPFTEGLINRLVVDLGVSKPWLKEGIGVPFEKTMPPRELDVVEPVVAAKGTPVYDIDVTAGCRSLETLFGEVRPVGYVELPGVALDSSLVQVRGDSMSPTIANGGYVAVRRVSGKNIFWGQIYVVELEEFRMVKYLRRHPESDKVILHSENPSYDDMDVSRSDIISLYLVETILNFDLRV
ncbi:MAG: hypothetical protein K2K55_03870 [Duncaniella sp.]|nr:hypothetical protein [Duncaniella sp.]